MPCFQLKYRFNVSFLFHFQVILNLDPNPEKVLSALNGLKSDFKDGHSFIDSALEEAANLLQSSKSSNHLNTLLIITDGYAFRIPMSSYYICILRSF